MVAVPGAAWAVADAARIKANRRRVLSSKKLPVLSNGFIIWDFPFDLTDCAPARHAFHDTQVLHPTAIVLVIWPLSFGTIVSKPIASVPSSVIPPSPRQLCESLVSALVPGPAPPPSPPGQPPSVVRTLGHAPVPGVPRKTALLRRLLVQHLIDLRRDPVEHTGCLPPRDFLLEVV